MREHASYYKQFIDVHPGGGQRRNPKRKNAGMYSTPVSFTPPTQEEIDRVFESHLGSMARGGTYGDNMEISAFASAFGIDVKIYQHDFAYMVSAPDTGAPRQVAHIAYHVRVILPKFHRGGHPLNCWQCTDFQNRHGNIIHLSEISMDHLLAFLTSHRKRCHQRKKPEIKPPRRRSPMSCRGW